MVPLVGTLVPKLAANLPTGEEEGQGWAHIRNRNIKSQDKAAALLRLTQSRRIKTLIVSG